MSTERLPYFDGTDRPGDLLQNTLGVRHYAGPAMAPNPPGPTPPTTYLPLEDLASHTRPLPTGVEEEMQSSQPQSTLHRATTEGRTNLVPTTPRLRPTLGL